MTLIVEQSGGSEEHAFLHLRLRHPSQGVGQLGASLGLSTSQAWSVGDRIGMTTRVRTENFWSHERLIGERRFGSQLIELVDLCFRHKREVETLTMTGGRVQFYIQLNGQLNSGESLSSVTLGRIAELNGELDVEVFPAWSR